MEIEPLLYIKFCAAFFLVVIPFGLTLLLIRKIADFLIALLMLGAVAAVCYSIYSGTVSSWEEIVALSIALGILACLICIPLIPFSSEYLHQVKNSSTNGQEALKKE